MKKLGIQKKQQMKCNNVYENEEEKFKAHFEFEKKANEEKIKVQRPSA